MKHNVYQKRLLKYFVFPLLLIPFFTFGASKSSAVSAAPTIITTRATEQYINDYYSSISTSLTGTALAGALETRLKAERKASFSYGSMQSSAFPYTDADPTRPNDGYIVSFYSGKAVKGYSGMNKEHTWPNSHGGNKIEHDPHMVRPTISSENSSRGNEYFSNTAAGWDPAELGDLQARGMAARIALYGAVIGKSSGLILEDVGRGQGAGTGNKMGKLGDLLKWNLEYPVNAKEILRNETLDISLNYNRNPFIDRPEYACQIWGETNANTRSICNIAPTVAVTSVSLTPTSGTVEVGETITLTSTVLPTNATNKALTWSSSNSSVATVNNGVVTGKSAGNVTITATAVSDSTKKATATITVKNKVIAVASVTLNKSELELSVGDAETLVATVLPNEATNKEVIWNSSDESVATVSKSGVVEALAPGETTVTVTSVSDATKKASATISVKNKVIAGTSITLNKEAATLTVGEEETFVATVLPNEATNKEVIWASSDESIATVSQSGVVEALAVGEIALTATLVSDPLISATATINVKNPEIKVTSITLDKSEVTLTVGEEETLVTTLLPNEATNKDVIWKSSDESVASVSESGVVAAKKEGSATISATSLSDETLSASATITVLGRGSEIKVTSIVFDKEELSLSIGDSETLTATLLPSNATNKALIWSSRDEDVATVTESGEVIAKAVGTTVVTATAVSDPSIKAEIVVKVGPNKYAVSGVSLNKEALTMNVGNKESLIVGVYPSTALDKSVIWKSSSEAIVSVSETGVVEALKVGKAVITVASVSDPSKKASTKITVTKDDIAVTGVSVNKKELILDVNDSETLFAAVLPSYATEKGLTWQSSDEKVATVSQSGSVSALAFGSAKITVLTSQGAFKEFIYVTVRSGSVSGDTPYQKALNWSAAFLISTAEGCDTSNSILLSAAWSENQSSYNALEGEVQEIIKETPFGYSEENNIGHAKARYRIILNKYALNDFIDNPVSSNQELATESYPHYIVFVVFGLMIAFVIAGIIVYKNKKVKSA